MATIFRGKVVTAVAVLSTTVAINAQPIQNRLILQPPPPSNRDFPTPARPLPPHYVHDVRNALVLYPTPLGAPYMQRDWPRPALAPPLPFVPDVPNRQVFLPPPLTRPAVQSDWPIPNQGLRYAPFVLDVGNRLILQSPPLRQNDWPLPAAPPRSLIADAILNPTVFLPRQVGQPAIVTDWPTPTPLPARPHGQIHHRPQAVPVVARPFIYTDWAPPPPRGPQLLVEPFRNGILLPLPPVGTPFAQREWPAPTRVPPKPDTFLFYYIQDQTSPGFIQFDWPKAPKLPSIPAEQVANRLVLPTVIVVLPPFSQTDWPTASTPRLAKVVDPYNTNVFLPRPVGLPTHQYDWPLPQGPRLKPDTHTLNDLGLLSLPVVNPEHRNYDWPLPARVMLLSVIWAPEGTTPIYLPTFRSEWAVNANQLLGPWAPQPETH